MSGWPALNSDGTAASFAGSGPVTAVDCSPGRARWAPRTARRLWVSGGYDMECAAQTAGTFPLAVCPIPRAGAQGRTLASENPQADLVRRAQAGDLDAFQQLFEQYQRGVYNIIFQMVRSDADAADLTQDVFVRVWKSLPRLEAPEAFASWLHRIATNLSRNWL